MLRGAGLRAGDLRVPLKRIGTFGVEVSKQAFRGHKDPVTGVPWKRLSKRYAIAKRRKGYDPLPMTRTARLRRSIHRLSIGARHVEWGTNVKYGPPHQYGGRMPQRRFLGLSKNDTAEITAIVNRWIMRSRP